MTEPTQKPEATANTTVSAKPALVEICVQEALNELKLLDKRIASATAEIQPTAIGYVNPSNESQKIEQDRFEATAKAKYQSVRSLIKRRAAIKGAIVVSNATTNVTVAGKTYTVASAIEYKKSIEMDRNLLSKLTAAYQATSRRFETVKLDYDRKLTEYLNGIGGSKENKNENTETLVAIFAARNAQHILDPLDLQSNLSPMQDDIEAFSSNVDFALTRSNITTIVRIPA